MPKRFISYSRTEPARMILLTVSIMTGLMQIAALFITGAFAWVALPNTSIVVAVCVWAAIAAAKNNLRHMSTSSFWMFLMWLWSGLSRALVSPDAAMLLWVPFVVVAIALSVVYIYLSHQKKAGTDE